MVWYQRCATKQLEIPGNPAVCCARPGANADDWQTTKAFPSGELNYSYKADPAACVKQIVMATAGAKL